MVTMSVFLLLRAVVGSKGNFTIMSIRAETEAAAPPLATPLGIYCSNGGSSDVVSCQGSVVHVQNVMDMSRTYETITPTLISSSGLKRSA